MKKKKLPIGFSDFKDVITGDYYYVDKTLFIKEVIDSGDKILLIPRPRRFGKTLNITMLKYFYDCCPDTWATDSQPSSPVTGPRSQNPNAHLFDSLAISGAGQEYLDKMGKYPVIYLSFREIKDSDWESCFENVKILIQEEFLRHYYLLDSRKLAPPEQDYFRKITNLMGTKSDYANSLRKLLIFLSRFYNQKAVILIDEYDTPVHAGYIHGYYDEIINFIRMFMGGGLKDTGQYLEKGVLTGIMRIARESIFSDLNNLGVYTLLSKKFNHSFGFTENEVKIMMEDFDILDMLEQVQRWYNGYRFGGKVIYNPWSIINFLNDEDKELKPYWINTSDNKVVDSLLSRGDVELRKELEQLIRGESIEKAIDENIILKDIDTDEDSFWSYLLMGGYLKQNAPRPDSGRVFYTLSVPNEEVKTTYQRI
ncbi:MAG TPA: AAA family ATPase, partial [Candidatus Deferrimicrobium sp.]|nr:AAA family ATPase [Candidatus Deferrimicrobium sp.]